MSLLFKDIKNSAGETQEIEVEESSIEGLVEAVFTVEIGRFIQRIVDFNTKHRIDEATGYVMIESIYRKPLNAITKICNLIDSFATVKSIDEFIAKSDQEIFFPHGMTEFLSSRPAGFQGEYQELSDNFKRILDRIYKLAADAANVSKAEEIFTTIRDNFLSGRLTASIYDRSLDKKTPLSDPKSAESLTIAIIATIAENEILKTCHKKREEVLAQSKKEEIEITKAKLEDESKRREDEIRKKAEEDSKRREDVMRKEFEEKAKAAEKTRKRTAVLELSQTTISIDIPSAVAGGASAVAAGDVAATAQEEGAASTANKRQRV